MNLPVPNLTTASTLPLEQLEIAILKSQNIIEAWFREEWQKTPAPFYASIDLRNSGFKLAPVDTNLFPAGFNNLNPDFDSLSIQATQTTLERYYPCAKKILLIPENHSRNLFYFKNLKKIYEILSKAGYHVEIGSIRNSSIKSNSFKNNSLKNNSFKNNSDMPETIPDSNIKIGAIEVDSNNRLHIGDFYPCIILLNNDLSDGSPLSLESTPQTVLPPPQLGWSSRLKSSHFGHYSDIANEFSNMIGIDPWFIDPYFENCGKIDFMQREGERCIERRVKSVLDSIKKKYEEYGIEKKPFVVVKADSGTYGMGIITVQDPEEITALNRKQRKKMATSKGNNSVTRVIIQEGVYTNETIGEDNAVAEPVIYHIDHFVIGGFYRVHKERSENENLNAPGAHFEPLAFSKTCISPDTHQPPDSQPNRFYAYGVISRLALLAAAREIKEINEIGNTVKMGMKND